MSRIIGADVSHHTLPPVAHDSELFVELVLHLHVHLTMPKLRELMFCSPEMIAVLTGGVAARHHVILQRGGQF
jgi:hypothetical protein